MNAAQQTAIGLIARAYEDCADMIKTLSVGALDGMPDLTERERALAQILLDQVSVSVRKKGQCVRAHFALALSEKGSA
jgi:hypothetical protein